MNATGSNYDINNYGPAKRGMPLNNYDVSNGDPADEDVLL